MNAAEHHINTRYQVFICLLNSGTLNPFRTAVPFFGKTTDSLSGVSPKRDCRPTRRRFDLKQLSRLRHGDTNLKRKSVAGYCALLYILPRGAEGCRIPYNSCKFNLNSCDASLDLAGTCRDGTQINIVAEYDSRQYLPAEQKYV